MNSTAIAFPNLGIYLENVPQSFTVFGVSITLYGCIIGFGVLCALCLMSAVAKKNGENPDLYWDFTLYALIFAIIGCRIYYVIFAWDFYKDNLLSIFNIRQGGLAIYGGIIAGVITLFVYSKIKKVNPFHLADIGFMGVITGQMIGRWGNFTNREVFGEYTDSLFAMRLPIAAVRSRDITENILAHVEEGANYIQVHPTFLYESAWNGLVLLAMVLYYRHRKFDGEVALLYAFGYGLGRFVIEGIRTDTLFIPGTSLPVSQALSAALVLFALVMDSYWRLHLKKKAK